MLPFSRPSCYFKTRPPSCALGTSFYTVSEGRDLMTYISDNYTSYSAPSPLAVFSRSPAAYEALKSFNILQLPSQATLQSYTAFLHEQGAGYHCISEQVSQYQQTMLKQR